MTAARAAGFAMIPPDDAIECGTDAYQAPAAAAFPAARAARGYGADAMNSTRRYIVRASVHLQAATRNTGVRDYVTHFFQPRAAA